MDDASENIEMFIKFAILPELVGKWFTKQHLLPLKPNSNEDTSSNLTLVAPFSGTTYHAYKYHKVMFQRAKGTVPIVIKKEAHNSIVVSSRSLRIGQNCCQAIL